MTNKGKVALGILGGSVIISGIAGIAEISDLSNNTTNSFNNSTNVENFYFEQNIIDNDINTTVNDIVSNFENNTITENSINNTIDSQPVSSTRTPTPTKVENTKLTQNPTEAENIKSTPKPTEVPKSISTPAPTQVPVSTPKPTTYSNVNSSNNKETSQTVWVGETGTKYHRQSCSTLKGKGHSITLNQALQEGRGPCKVCKP